MYRIEFGHGIVPIGYQRCRVVLQIGGGERGQVSYEPRFDCLDCRDVIVIIVARRRRRRRRRFLCSCLLVDDSVIDGDVVCCCVFDVVTSALREIMFNFSTLSFFTNREYWGTTEKAITTLLWWMTIIAATEAEANSWYQSEGGRLSCPPETNNTITVKFVIQTEILLSYQ